MIFVYDAGSVQVNQRLLFGNPPATAGYEPTFANNVTYSTPQLQANASRICGSNAACLFDTALTDSIDFGQQTRAVDDENNKQKAEIGQY